MYSSVKSEENTHDSSVIALVKPVFDNKADQQFNCVHDPRPSGRVIGPREIVTMIHGRDHSLTGMFKETWTECEGSLFSAFLRDKTDESLIDDSE